MKASCSCGEITFELTDRPIFVQCCHCRMCQRQSGTAFALNALIEADKVLHHTGTPEVIEMPSANPHGQQVSRCPTCKVAVWSVYPGAGPKFRFVRVGALEDPDQCPPQVHIFTQSKQPWVQLGSDIPAFEHYYDREQVWPASALERRRVALGETGG